MSPITTIIAEVAAAAKVNDQGENPEAHAALLHSIERLRLAAEKPTETARRIIYQVERSYPNVPLSEITMLTLLYE